MHIYTHEEADPGVRGSISCNLVYKNQSANNQNKCCGTINRLTQLMNELQLLIMWMNRKNKSDTKECIPQ